MRKETTLCMGCMTYKESGDCPHCGYGEGNVRLASYLAPSTYLAERYIIGKLISYNGEGALYLAFDEKNGVKVTVKEYMPETLCSRKKDEENIKVNADSIALYKTYLSEFIVLNKTLMSADKGNLQKVQDVFTLNNTAYVVYEYILGESLKNHLTNIGNALTWSQTRELFTPVLETLRQIHSHGILHRGLSCTTLLVSDSDELMLIGFAITAARTYGSDINFEVFPGYAPPELYCTTGRHGCWTDVYGISAVLYKTLTGKTPPDAVARKENDELAHPLSLNGGIPKNVSDILMKGLSLDAEKRFQTIAEFADKLLEIPENPLEMGLIKKPPVNHARKGNYSQNSASKKNNGNRKNKSNSTAILICVVLCLTIIGFIAAISIPALFPITPAGNNGGTTTDVSTSARVISETTQTSAVQTSPVNEPLYRVPNFTDRPLELIQNSTAYSYLIITPVYEFNAEYKDGCIIEQDILPDTEVTYGTELTVRVSKGPETVKLPDYTGLNYEKYAKQLASLNIKFETKSEDSAEVKKGIVTRCSVEAGSVINVAASETVIIYYSTGKAPAETGISPADDENNDELEFNDE